MTGALSNRTRLVLGLCLAWGVAACGGGDGGDPGAGAAGAGSGGKASGGAGGGGSGGSAGATAGSGGGGQGGSSGSGSSGGSSGSSASGGEGGTGGASGSSGSGGGGGSAATCVETDRGCRCDPFPPQGDEVLLCTAQSVNGMCCEDALGSCSCRTWSCENDSLGCTCGSSTDGPMTACNGVFGVCCLSVIGTASSCYCDDVLTECVGENDVEVDNCTIDIAPCAAGETEVDACKE